MCVAACGVLSIPLMCEGAVRDRTECEQWSVRGVRKYSVIARRLGASGHAGERARRTWAERGGASARQRASRVGVRRGSVSVAASVGGASAQV